MQPDRTLQRPSALPRSDAVAAVGLLLLATTLFSVPAVADERAREWLTDYLRIDTTNPPGNEGEAVEYLAGILHDAGIATRRFVTPEGRTSLLAKIEAEAAEPRSAPLLLLHHIDVVPAGEGWSVEPFEAVQKDGLLYGRGAIDSKSLGIAHLAAFLDVAQDPEALERDVWYMASADEEAGGSEGVGWIFERHPEVLGDVGAVLTEAGVNRVINGEVVWWGIEVAQKRPLWMRLRTRARGGHGSSYHPGSATHQMVLALGRLLRIERDPHLSLPAYRFFHSLVPFYGPAFGTLFDQPTLEEARAAIDQAVRENRLHKSLLPGMSNHLLDTVQVTNIDNGDTGINVVPPVATASVDIRLLPDTDEEAFLARVTEALGSSVEVEVVLRADEAMAADLDEPTYRRLEEVLGDTAPVIPTFIPGTTDSRYFRERGIPAYGFSPFTLSGIESRGIHNVDESIPLERLDEGVVRMVDVLRHLVLTSR